VTVISCSDEVIIATLSHKVLKCLFISNPSLAGGFFSQLSIILENKIHDYIILSGLEMVHPLKKEIPVRVLSTYLTIITKFGPITNSPIQTTHNTYQYNRKLRLKVPNSPSPEPFISPISRTRTNKFKEKQ